MKKSAIAWAAVLALALTSCGNAPSKAPETEQKTTVETLHMLDIEQGDVVYEDFSDAEIGLSDYSERRLLYEIDETTATARPVCAVPDCAHTDKSCPAYLQNSMQCYVADDAVYAKIYNYVDSADGASSYDSLEKINADRTERTVVQKFSPFTRLMDGMASDAENLYFTLCKQDRSANTVSQTVCRLNKQTGKLDEIYCWDTLADSAGNIEQKAYRFMDAENNCLYFAKETGNDDGDTIIVGTLNLDTCEYTELQHYEEDKQTVVPFSLDNFGYSSGREYGYTNSGGETDIVEYDNQNGTVAVIDTVTGQRTVLAENLPITDTANKTEYTARRYVDGYMLEIQEEGRDASGAANGVNTERQFYCKNGTMTEITQKYYLQGEEMEPITVADIRDGRVLAVCDAVMYTVQNAHENGTIGSEQVSRGILGVLSMENFLNGSVDYTPLVFTQ